ncbi:2OG-Fe(II) oxygenase [Hyphomonas sp.]|uniref:2OG-Fe(II) oxygenase n=1 Tax=Hyphomonas sp. TaxID=87 RepID=UPI00391A0FD3
MTDTTAAGLSPAELASKAEAGDAEAALFLARVLFGQGKMEESFNWILKSAKEGHPVAATELGLRLVVGNGAPTDPAAGIKWIDAAVKAGFPEAVRWRALFLAAGVGGTINFPAALNMLEAAAQSGEPYAQAQLQCIRASGINSDESLAAFLNPPAPLLFSESPWVTAAEHVLPEPMCNWWIAAASTRLQKAQVHDADAGGRRQDGMRTNSGAGFSILQTDVVMQLCLARIAVATGRPRKWQEAPNVLHYSVGEEYGLHYDFLDPANPHFADGLAKYGQRRTTALIYLNQNFMEGQTWFEAIQKHARTPAGGMLAFDNVLNDGSPDPRTLHAGLPVTMGEKWLLSIWIRDREQPVI